MRGNRTVRRWALLVALAGAGAGLAGVGSAPAEIGIAEQGGVVVAPEGPVLLECWQNGVRIVNRAGLPGPGAGGATVGGDRIVFGRGGRGAAVLVGFPEALCLITEQ